MTCDDSRSVLHAYLDGELEAPRAAEFKKHLEGCPACTRAFESQESLRSSMQRAKLSEPLPSGLESKIRSQLPKSPAPARTKKFPVLQWLAAAAVLVLVAGASWKFGQISRERVNAAVAAGAAEIVDAHIRALQPGHLTDVTSTDQHTVKPWFDGKVPFAPPVRDFAGQGFPLVGGRLDVFQGQTVAALVYGRRKHFVSVFVWLETAAESEEYTGAQNGYQWISWKQSGLRYCAVSDANADDLAALKNLLTH
jgi:anti-sigma factor (TIGR02949 family)